MAIRQLLAAMLWLGEKSSIAAVAAQCVVCGKTHIYYGFRRQKIQHLYIGL